LDFLLDVDGQRDHKCRPLARFALNGNISMKFLDQAVGNGEAEAGSLALLFSGKKRFEDLIEVIF
jgi:hypothetical protein